jgi:hypothetical protein
LLSCFAVLVNNAMKKLLLIFLSVFFISFIGILSFGCIKFQTEAIQISDNNIPVIDPSGDDISTLEIGKLVKFPAVLVRSIGSSCVELFIEDEYKKYDGDGKWAITAKFQKEPSFLSRLFGSKTVMVKGKMTIVKDSKDTSNTCGIGTGNIFEIIEISELKNDQH